MGSGGGGGVGIQQFKIAFTIRFFILQNMLGYLKEQISFKRQSQEIDLIL